MKQKLFAMLMVLAISGTVCMPVRAAEDIAIVETTTIAAEQIQEAGTGAETVSEDGLSAGKVGPDDTRMKYLARVGASIHIMDDGTATVTADATAYNTITNLLVVAELQQQINGQWVTLRTYRYFTASPDVIISETCNVSRGYYYRVVNTTTAYAGSDSETQVLETGAWNFFVPGTY